MRWRLLVAFALVGCGSSGTLGDDCPSIGDTTACDPGQVCAPKDASAVILACSIECQKDADCGLNEHCGGYRGGVGACFAE